MHFKVLSGIENIYNSCIMENIVSLHFYRENDCVKGKGRKNDSSEREKEIKKVSFGTGNRPALSENR